MTTVPIYLLVILLLLLQLKHHYLDYRNQTDDEQLAKTDLFRRSAIIHSIRHGAATALCLIVVFPAHPLFAVIAGAADTVVHHLIDFFKTRIEGWNNSLIGHRYIWGVDQLFHQLSYLALILVVGCVLH